MADFPTIYPESVAIEAGRMVTDRIATPSGPMASFRRSLGKRDVTFNLVYTNLTASEIGLIRSHFIDNFDLSTAFAVPLAILSGTGIVSEFASFYYDAPIQETQKGIYSDLTVSFRAFDDDNSYLILDPGTSEARTEELVPKTKANLSTYIFSGTDPFILNGDDANPAASAAVIIEGGKANP